MSYAQISDMIVRFGEVELIRLSTPDGQNIDGIWTTVVQTRLDEASGVIDSYLRRRYAVPITGTIPPEIVRACCALARYELAFGPNTEPTEQMRLAKKDVLGWLAEICDGRVTLDGVEPAGIQSQAMTSDRPAMVGGAMSGACYNVGQGPIYPGGDRGWWQ